MSKKAAANYAAAVLSADAGTVEIYRTAFEPPELLTAVETQLALLGRYLGYRTGRTPTQVGDALKRAAIHLTSEGEL